MDGVGHEKLPAKISCSQLPLLFAFCAIVSPGVFIALIVFASVAQKGGAHGVAFLSEVLLVQNREMNIADIGHIVNDYFSFVGKISCHAKLL